VWYVPGMFLEQPSLRFRSFLTLVQFWTRLHSTGPCVITAYFHVPLDMLLDFIVKFHFSILGFTDNYSNYLCKVLLWTDYAILSATLCFFASCQCSVPANLSLIFFSTFWCISIIYSHGLKLFPCVFQQDFLMNLFSCITMPSFLIHLLLKVLQPVVIRCLVAPSESHPSHRVMENTTLLAAVICFVKLSGAL